MTNRQTGDRHNAIKSLNSEPTDKLSKTDQKTYNGLKMSSQTDQLWPTLVHHSHNVGSHYDYNYFLEVRPLNILKREKNIYQMFCFSLLHLNIKILMTKGTALQIICTCRLFLTADYDVVDCIKFLCKTIQYIVFY